MVIGPSFPWAWDPSPVLKRLPFVLPSSIQRITISFPGDDNRLFRLGHDINVHWNGIDKHLSDVAQFPQLEYVELRWGARLDMREVDRGKTSNEGDTGEENSEEEVMDYWELWQTTAYLKHIKADLVEYRKQWDRDFISLFPRLIACGILWLGVENWEKNSTALQVSHVEMMDMDTWNPPYRRFGYHEWI